MRRLDRRGGSRCLTGLLTRSSFTAHGVRAELGVPTKHAAAEARQSPPPAWLMLGAGMVTGQIGAAMAKRLFEEIGPPCVVFLRTGLTAGILLIVWRPGLHWQGWSRLALIGAFGTSIAAMNLCFYEAIARIPLGVAVTVEFLGPLTVALLGSRRLLDVLWAVLAAGGVVLLAWAGSHTTSLGMIFALATATMLAAYIFLSKQVASAFRRGSGLALAMTVATLLLAVPGVMSGGTRLSSVQVLVNGLAVAVLSSLIPYSLQHVAVRRLRTATLGVLMSLEPAVAVLAGLVLLRQHLRAVQLLAIALVVVASGGSVRSGHVPDGPG
jgi:inner membrane transporter RhtA